MQIYLRIPNICCIFAEKNKNGVPGGTSKHCGQN